MAKSGKPKDDFGPDLPDEELDMIVDELVGHPQARSAADRVKALEKRIAYLKDSVDRSTSHGTEAGLEAASSFRKDLQDARRQLEAARLELKGQN